VDDYVPVYTSGVAGVSGGNPFLQPEESESFTFSTVIRPRFIPNFSLVLDYYEIEITNVIASVTAQTAANNCVNGTGLNTAACSTIFRRVAPIANPQSPQDASEAFKVGAPQGDPIGGFIQGSINYAALTTRGLDFTATYRWDFEEMMGRDWGVLNYSIGGLWLIEQENFLNAANPNDGNELSSDLFYPRVRFTSSLTWTPNDVWSVNWSMDWQTSQDILSPRDFINNADSRAQNYLDTGNFARHDFTFRWNVRDDLSLRTGVVNAFDNEQAEWLGTTLYSNFDPYGRRFFIGLNYRPF
jgi:outer membrane receptor protein involved in Fe transport